MGPLFLDIYKIGRYKDYRKRFGQTGHAYSATLILHVALNRLKMTHF